MSAEDIEYMDDYKEFPTKESALDWLDYYLSPDERNNLIRALQQEYGHQTDDSAEIKVGDEVKSEGNLFVVVRVCPEDDDLEVINCNGICYNYNLTYTFCRFKKTGRHFPQIAEVLKQMKEDERRLL